MTGRKQRRQFGSKINRVLFLGGASDWILDKAVNGHYRNNPAALAHDLVRDGFSPHAEIVTAAKKGEIEKFRNGTFA